MNPVCGKKAWDRVGFVSAIQRAQNFIGGGPGMELKLVCIGIDFGMHIEWDNVVAAFGMRVLQDWARNHVVLRERGICGDSDAPLDHAGVGSDFLNIFVCVDGSEMRLAEAGLGKYGTSSSTVSGGAASEA